MRVLFLLIAIFSLGSAKGQFDLSQVPDSLKEGAKHLIIYDSTLFHVENINESYLEKKYKLVVLNDPLEDGVETYLAHNDYRDIKYANVVVSTIFGAEIESYKLKDFQDVSTKGFSLASDDRLMYHQVIESRFPYIVEVSYKVMYSGSMFYPLWRPQFDDVSVITSTFIVESQIPNSFRHKSYNVTPRIEGDGKKAIWTVNNLPAYNYEYYSRKTEDFAPIVYTAPNQFQMDGIEGDMSSWENFGDWILELSSGKDDMANHMINDLILQIPEDADDLEKTKMAYNYLQNNTRYVSIQLGIGGWQPFNASFVHEKKFGDCKALSFYTKSVLEKLGVTSYYTLINAGKYSSITEKDFPMSRFNHAILTVPLKEDTVWLECTSQTNPFGYLGTFTSDRNALIITDGESRIIRTRSYSPEENAMSSSYSLTMNEDGTVSATLDRSYKGLMIEKSRFDNISLSSSKDQLEWFYDKNDWSSMSVESISIEPPSDEIVPEGKLQVDFLLKNAIKRGGKRLFLDLSPYFNSAELIIDKEKKKYPFEMRYNSMYVDSLKLTISPGYVVENPMKSIDVNTDFGDLNLTFEQSGDQITIRRELKVFKGNHEAVRYDAFQDFVRQVKKTESKRLVLINKT